MKDKTGKYIRIDGMVNDKNWLYQKYTIERLSWNDFYEKYNISYTLLQNRLKEFNIKRERVAWNKNIKGIMKSNKTSFKKGHNLGVRFGRDKDASGSNHWNWKGGITPLYNLLRGLDEYKEWRMNCLKRDWFKCQDCRSKIKLVAHHLKSLKELITEFLKEYNQFSPIEDRETLIRLAITYQPFWDIDNGKTLCDKCHKSLRSKICLD